MSYERNKQGATHGTWENGKMGNGNELGLEQLGLAARHCKGLSDTCAKACRWIL